MFLCLFCSMQVFGQFRLSGIIRDAESMEALSGAGIRLEGFSETYSSDRNGEFLFPSLKAGSYTIQVHYLGYSAYTRTVELTRNLEIEILMQAGSFMAEGIQIKASRLPDKAAGTLYTLPSREIRKINNGQDLPMLLQGTPSAVSTSDAGSGIGYTGLRIRGTDMTRINVTVNGVPFNDPESHEVYWVDIPDIASSIDNVQIQRGVGTSVNGAASFGASINIQTTGSGETPYAEIDNTIGSFNTRNMLVRAGSGLIRNQWAFDARYSNISSDGYIDRATARLESWFLTGAWHGKSSVLKLNIFSGKERTYQAWDGISAEMLKTDRTFNPNGMYTDDNGHVQFYENEVDDYRQDHYHLMFTQKTGKHSWLSSTLHYTHGEGYYEQYEEDDTPSYYGISVDSASADESDLVTRKWLDNDFYGIGMAWNTRTQTFECIAGGAVNHYEGRHFGQVIFAAEPGVSLSDYLEWYRNTGDKTDANVFGKLRYSLTKQLNAFADLQFRYIDYKMKGPDDDYRDLSGVHRFRFLNPKTGLSWDLSRHQNLQLSLAIANREPSRSNFKDADPAALPKPERLYNTELSWSYTTAGRQLSLCWYFMGYHNQLVLTGEINSVGAPVMVNVEQSYRTGLELVFGMNLLPKLEWKGNLGLSRNRIVDFVSFVDDWDNGGQIRQELGESPLSFSPSVTANNTLSWKILSAFTAEWVTRYVGKQYIDNTGSNERSLDPYLVNDLRLRYTLVRKKGGELALRLSINNILNEEYESNAWVYRYFYGGEEGLMNGYFPQAGRNAMLGLSLKF